MSDNLRQLVKRCLAGDERAMHDLVERFRGRVFSLCWRMLGQRQDAEDAVQDTFVRALRHLARWDEEREFEPWLLAIAGNRCRTAIAERMRRPNAEPLGAEIADATAPASHAWSEEIQLGLNSLRVEYRQAFLLFHDQGLSYEQIAQRMSCPVGTAKTWVHRARQELFAYLRHRDLIEESRHALRAV